MEVKGKGTKVTMGSVSLVYPKLYEIDYGYLNLVGGSPVLYIRQFSVLLSFLSLATEIAEIRSQFSQFSN